MTNNEIKSALKYAILNAKEYGSKVWSIEVYKLENALDLINRLQAENERLKKVTGDVIKVIFQEEIQEAKAEAYKEFAEKLKAIPSADKDVQYVFELRIDNLLKELVGETDES